MAGCYRQHNYTFASLRTLDYEVGRLTCQIVEGAPRTLVLDAILCVDWTIMARGAQVVCVGGRVSRAVVASWTRGTVRLTSQILEWRW